MQLKVIETPSDIKLLTQYLKDFEYIAVDTETNGLLKTSEIIGVSVCAEEEVAYYIILAKWEVDKLVYIHNKPEVFQLLTLLTEKQLIMHNAVFDCSMIENNFKISLIEALHTDTMILAHLLNENRRAGLKPLASEYFGENSTKEQAEMEASVKANGGLLTKDCYEMYKADSQLMGKYGAKDALLTYKLFMTLVPELYDQGLEDFFYKDESMPLLRTTTYELNTTGLQVDCKALTTLKKSLQAECAEIKHYVYTEIDTYIHTKYPGTKKTNTFNIGASQQLSWLLFGELQLEFGSLTEGGKAITKSLGMKCYSVTEKRNFIEFCISNENMVLQPEATINGKKIRAKKLKAPWGYIKCDKKTLIKIAAKYKWVDKLLEYQSKLKLLNTYVKGIESRVQYGVIHPSFLQHGTTSGRYASRDPNFQNLPRKDQRIKECIVARPGKVFVGADYSQLEPRVFAYMSQDKRLMATFEGTADFYSTIGMDVFNKTDCTPQKEGPNAFGTKYKALRDLSKTIALAAVYGATAYRLAPETGKSIDDTQLIIDNYFDSFPNVKLMMDESKAQAKKDGQVTNLFGRPRRLPELKKIASIYGKTADEDLPYELKNLLNLSINHRIQSTAASIVNRASIQFLKDCKTAGISCKLVSQIHDELIAECSEQDAETISILLQNAMEETTILPGVKLEAIPRITKTFAK